MLKQLLAPVRIPPTRSLNVPGLHVSPLETAVPSNPASGLSAFLESLNLHLPRVSR